MQQQVLGGRYLLKDKVGTGGMATVYRAQDQVLNRTVAVKIMLPQYAGDATFAARFKQEAQAAAGLSSPYIVGVYDWGKDGDTYYIVMEYLRGTDLKSGIRSHGALDPKKVAQIGSQICAALSVAHKHEIIHRDIKPQNIMVLPDGNIKVMDFGIARAKNSHLTQDNNVLGTAHYVSPEQTRGQELGPTSDIYSLGVVMYECATGQVPFDGDDAISVALKQVNELPVPPSQLNPNLDADLERIILRCMEKDPANRFQTADELRQTLNAYLAGRQVDVPEPTRVSVVPAGGAGTTETRVMSDQTQAMARPAGIGNTAVRSGSGMSSSASGGADPYGGKKKGGKGKIVAGVVAALAIIGVIAFAAFSALNSGAKTVTVPNVLGYTQEDATEELRSLNLGVKTSSGYSDEYEEGEVMSQTPSGGLQVEEGYEVEIQISRGPEPIKTTTVPDLKGRTREEAEKLLEEAGLVGVASEASNDAEEGTVFEQSPAEGEEVEEGSTVTYTVSTGPGTVSIPNVVGDGENSAAGALEDAGFSVSREYEYSSRVDAGVVISQSLTGSAMPGTTITSTISRGPEPDTSTPDTPATSPDSPTTGEDEEGSAGAA
ncbi:Stk1 family PASTA domain-containing Ser/Thr kinase [Enorma massiliensis]|uniref:Stk1 family PASTA domain-containing Ser/Thr kinase n=2 Tax=Enorma massiliensis TaxID=1472761 RepID=UPI003AF1B324